MRIAIDARVIERRMSGIARYLLGFLEYLSQLDNKNQYFLFCYDDLPRFKKIGYKIIATGKNKFLPDKIYNLYWQEFVLPPLLQDYKIDVFFNPNHYLPLRKISSRGVITIHDLAHKVDPSYKNFIYRFLYLEKILPKSIKKADLILTISENSKADILKYYGNLTLEDKIKVICPAADERFKPGLSQDYELIKNVQKKYHLPAEFILYVGRIEKRKNIKGIIRIAQLLPERMFVLVGEVGYSGSKELLKEIKEQKNIYHLNFIDDEDLPYIYNLGKVFLFPSFYEGFGLPVLEAMKSGLPVVTSNTSSLPEIVGDGGIMHSPNDYQSFAKDIRQLFEDEKFYQEMKERAIAQAQKFNWQKSTEELVEVFDKLFGKGKILC